MINTNLIIYNLIKSYWILELHDWIYELSLKIIFGLSWKLLCLLNRFSCVQILVFSHRLVWKLHVICTTSSCYLLSKSLDCEFDLSYITFLKLCNNPFCREELACVKTNETFMMNISSYIFLFLEIMKTKIKRYFKRNCLFDNYWKIAIIAVK